MERLTLVLAPLFPGGYFPSFNIADAAITVGAACLILDEVLRVRRGGSWHSWGLYARCGYRNWNAPSTRYTLVGMRLLLESE